MSLEQNPSSTETIIHALERKFAELDSLYRDNESVFSAFKNALEEAGYSDDYNNWVRPLDNLTETIEAELLSLNTSIANGDIEATSKSIKFVQNKVGYFNKELKNLETALDSIIVKDTTESGDVTDEINIISRSLSEGADKNDHVAETEVVTKHKEAARVLEIESRATLALVEELSKELKDTGLLNEFTSELASSGFHTRRVKDNLASILGGNNEKLSGENAQNNINQIKSDLEIIFGIGMKMRTRLFEASQLKRAEIEKVDGKENSSQSSDPEAVEAGSSAPVEKEKRYTPEKLNQLAQLYKDKNELVFNSEDGRYKGLATIKVDIRNILRNSGYSRMEDHFMRGVNDIAIEITRLTEEKKAEVGKKAKFGKQNVINSLYKDLLSLVSEVLNKPPVKEEEITTEVFNESDVDASISTLLNEAEKYCPDLRSYQYGVGSKTENESRTIMSLRLVNHLIKEAEKNERDPLTLENKKLRYLKQLQKDVQKLRQEALQEAITAGPPKDISKIPVLTDILVPPVLTDIVEPPVLTDIVEPFAIDEPLAEVTPGVVTVAAEPASMPENAGYKSKREHWTTKENFKQKEKSYQDAMEAFYQDPSLKTSARNSIQSVSKLFGFKPELPIALQQMQKEYKEHRQLYATSLDEMMHLRASSFSSVNDDIVLNNEYHSDSDSTRVAFGRKFILKPNEEMLKLQERELFSPENRARLTRAMFLIKKYKNTLRVGMIIGAGTMAAGAAAAAGAATIGVAAAAGAGGGFKALKIAASVAIGAGGGVLAKEATQGRVDGAKKNLEMAKSGVVRQFTLDDMDTLEENLQSAEFKKKQAENIQKVAVGGAAVATGLAGYEASSLVEEFKLPETGSFSAESVNKLAENITDSVVSFVFPDMSAPYESVSGASGYVKFSDIKFIGSGELDATHEGEMTQFINDTAKDLVATNPHLSEAKIETALLEKFQNKFGETEWVREANISKIDIGKYENIPSPNASEALLDEGFTLDRPVSTESVPSSVEAISHSEYQVQKGDTIWDILKSENRANSPEFSKLSNAEQNVVLDKLLEKVRINPELAKTLGLKSGVDIDLIYPGENIKLADLNQELADIVKNQEQISTYTKSAGLNVLPDNDVKNVDINVVEKPVAEESIITEVEDKITDYEKPVSYGYSDTPEVNSVEAITRPLTGDFSAPEPIKAPTFMSVSGNPFELREYQNYLTQKYGDLDTFTKFVNKQALTFEDQSYGALEKNSFFGTDYQSPYTMLGEMSLKEIDEFSQQPSSVIRQTLLNNDMKYETYLSWIDKIQEMKDLKNSGLQIQPQTKLSGLFAQYVDKVNETKINPYIA